MENVGMTLGQALDMAKSAHKRIDDVESEVKNLRTLTLAIAKVDSKVDNIKEDVEDIKKEVKQVSNRPLKVWDRLIAAAIGALASGIVAAILATILK